MKRFFLITTVVSALLASCGSKHQTKVEEPATPKFSTFSDHVFSVARQDSISVREAAEWVRSVGIEGLDCRTTMTPEMMAAIDSAGLKHACAILDLSYSKEPVEEMEEKALTFCADYGFTRLMYCPTLLPEEGVAPEAMDSILLHLNAYAEKANAAGVEILFEDYDNPRSLTFNIAALDKVFAAVPNAKHSYDTGNFFFAGDDPMAALERFRQRITHVHLKDRMAVGDKASPIIGTGVVPCREIVNRLMSEGYDGWFVIEGYGSKDMKEQLEMSVRNLTE
ncbi:MAG: sugar phosphate isomerase/epimerase [Bacteroidaceae bacterium]|nr:sugar phosphate isomerase/epimerase [Bacteroidaceae bacterium]